LARNNSKTAPPKSTNLKRMKRHGEPAPAHKRRKSFLISLWEFCISLFSSRSTAALEGTLKVSSVVTRVASFIHEDLSHACLVKEKQK
jgi:hypothetical protein